MYISDIPPAVEEVTWYIYAWMALYFTCMLIIFCTSTDTLYCSLLLIDKLKVVDSLFVNSLQLCTQKERKADYMKFHSIEQLHGQWYI